MVFLKNSFSRIYSNFSRISPGKRIFKQNHFSLFIRGQMASIHEIKNGKKFCDTAPLRMYTPLFIWSKTLHGSPYRQAKRYIGTYFDFAILKNWIIGHGFSVAVNNLDLIFAYSLTMLTRCPHNRGLRGLDVSIVTHTVSE